MQAAKRDTRVDIIKGIGILLMVLGHASFPGTRFVYLFHMAVFFIATGYLFKDSNTESLGSVSRYIGKRIKTLWLPYVLADTIYNILNNFFKAVHIYANSALKEELPWGGMLMVMPARTLTIGDIWQRFLGAIRFRGSAEFGMAMWFLQALFGVTVLFVILDYIVKQILKKCIKSETAQRVAEDIVMGIISVAFLILGYQISKKHSVNLWGFEKSLTCFILVYLGRILKRYLQKAVFEKNPVTIVCGVISCIGLIIANGHGRIELSANQITSPGYFILVSLMGWFFLFAIATVIDKVGILQKAFALFGRNSLAIVITHFLAFRIVSAIIVAVYGLPIDAVASTPIISAPGAWWLLYGVVGVCVPVACNEARKYLWKRYLNRKN